MEQEAEETVVGADAKKTGQLDRNRPSTCSDAGVNDRQENGFGWEVGSYTPCFEGGTPNIAREDCVGKVDDACRRKDAGNRSFHHPQVGVVQAEVGEDCDMLGQESFLYGAILMDIKK